MIKRNNKLSVRRQCELLGINRSSIYYEPLEPDTAAILLDEDLMSRIDYWHNKCPYLGSRKIVTKLSEEGYPVCRKTVRRLMR